jgi:hypothetical protein
MEHCARGFYPLIAGTCPQATPSIPLLANSQAIPTFEFTHEDFTSIVSPKANKHYSFHPASKLLNYSAFDFLPYLRSSHADLFTTLSEDSAPTFDTFVFSEFVRSRTAELASSLVNNNMRYPKLRLPLKFNTEGSQITVETLKSVESSLRAFSVSSELNALFCSFDFSFSTLRVESLQSRLLFCTCHHSSWFTTDYDTTKLDSEETTLPFEFALLKKNSVPLDFFLFLYTPLTATFLNAKIMNKQFIFGKYAHINSVGRQAHLSTSENTTLGGVPTCTDPDSAIESTKALDLSEISKNSGYPFTTCDVSTQAPSELLKLHFLNKSATPRSDAAARIPQLSKLELRLYRQRLLFSYWSLFLKKKTPYVFLRSKQHQLKTPKNGRAVGHLLYFYYYDCTISSYSFLGGDHSSPTTTSGDNSVHPVVAGASKYRRLKFLKYFSSVNLTVLSPTGKDSDFFSKYCRALGVSTQSEYSLKFNQLFSLPTSVAVTYQDGCVVSIDKLTDLVAVEFPSADMDTDSFFDTPDPHEKNSTAHIDNFNPEAADGCSGDSFCKYNSGSWSLEYTNKYENSDEVYSSDSEVENDIETYEYNNA